MNAVKFADKIYVGGTQAAKDLDFLGDADITAIINLSGFEDEEIEDVQINSYVLYNNELLEDELPKFMNRLTQIVTAVKNYIAEGRNVLIHCDTGTNRSYLVAGYFCKTERGMSYQAIMDIIKAAAEARKVAGLSNMSFRKILNK